MCYFLMTPTWFSFPSFTWDSYPGKARCCVFLRSFLLGHLSRPSGDSDVGDIVMLVTLWLISDVGCRINIPTFRFLVTDLSILDIFGGRHLNISSFAQVVNIIKELIVVKCSEIATWRERNARTENITDLMFFDSKRINLSKWPIQL